VLVHAAPLLVHEKALLALQQAGEELGSLGLGFFLVGAALAALAGSGAVFGGVDPVEVAHQGVRVEIVLLEAEGSRYFTTLVQVRLGEHLLALVVLDDVAGGGVSQVAALVGGSSGLVLDVAFFVLEDDDVALLIAVEISKDILDVEISPFMVWRHLDCRITPNEVLQGLIHDLKLTIIDAGQQRSVRFASVVTGALSLALVTQLLLEALEVFGFADLLLGERSCLGSFSVSFHFGVQLLLSLSLDSHVLFGLCTLELLLKEFVFKTGFLLGIFSLVLGFFKRFLLTLESLLLQPSSFSFLSRPLLSKQSIFFFLLPLLLVSGVTVSPLIVCSLPRVVFLLEGVEFGLGRPAQFFFLLGLDAVLLGAGRLFNGSLLFAFESFLFLGRVFLRPVQALRFSGFLGVFEGLGVFGGFGVAAFAFGLLGLGLLPAEIGFVAFSLETGFFVTLTLTILFVELALFGIILLADFGLRGIFLFFARLPGRLVGVVLGAGLETGFGFQFFALKLSLVLQFLVSLLFVQK